MRGEGGPDPSRFLCAEGRADRIVSKMCARRSSHEGRRLVGRLAIGKYIRMNISDAPPGAGRIVMSRVGPHRNHPAGRGLHPKQMPRSTRERKNSAGRGELEWRICRLNPRYLSKDGGEYRPRLASRSTWSRFVMTRFITSLWPRDGKAGVCRIQLPIDAGGRRVPAFVKYARRSADLRGSRSGSEAIRADLPGRGDRGGV